MTAIDRDTATKVERLLERQGEYLPLELLLAEGRLLYNDYDQWRAGDIERLDDCLFGDAASILQLLAQAADYARARRLLPVPLQYRGWAGGAPLQFSADNRLDQLFQTAYRKDPGIPQLDLFLDNVGNNLANDAIAALVERDYPRARQAVEQLMQSDPLHSRIDPLLSLIDSAQQPMTEADDQALRQLDEHIVPLAQELLCARADNLLIPLWRGAAQVLEGRPFEAQQPLRHASRYWQLAGDWLRTLESIEAEPDWRGQPELLLRHASANATLKRQQAALLDLCQVGWVFPARIAECIERMDGLFLHPWNQFLDQEDDLEPTDFPAWLLILLPAQGTRPSEEQLAGLSPAPGFLSLLRLVHAERQALAPTLRAQLKAERPELLRCYLTRK